MYFMTFSGTYNVKKFVKTLDCARIESVLRMNRIAKSHNFCFLGQTYARVVGLGRNWSLQIQKTRLPCKFDAQVSM